MRGATAEKPAGSDLVLLGGGHSHIAVARAFGMRPEPGLRLTLVSRDVLTPYSGMLPGLLAGHYGFQDCHIDLRALCHWAGVRLIPAEVHAIDLEAARVHCHQRPPLRFDLLSLNTGSRPALHSISGATEFGIAVKPVDRLLLQLEKILSDLKARPRNFRLLIVGGGAASIEVAMACEYRLRQELEPRVPRPSLVLLTQSEQLLPLHNPAARQRVLAQLQKRGIEVLFGEEIQSVEAGRLFSASGRQYEFDEVIWAIHAGAPAWMMNTGLPCDQDGFIRVDNCLRSTGDVRVFASGDIASLPGPVAKSGVYAVRQGPLLAHNLRACFQGRGLRAYRPQRRFLSLLSTGDRHAIASRGRWCAEGGWVWRWKDTIDRRFMQRFEVPHSSPAVADTDASARCGGCGAKVGASVLSAALDSLRSGVDGEILPRSHDDAAVIDWAQDRQLVQSVDYFRAFVDDPWLLGRIAVNHCVGDLHAMGAEPHSALAIAGIPHAAPALVEEDLRQLMHGALSALEQENMQLLGGHSSETAELGFGLAVNGRLRPGTALAKGPLESGQALILTKALGSGTLLAANMVGLARGDHIESAIAAMQQSQRTAAELSRAYGVQACTDITGFGLLGHLLEMLRDSDCEVQLELADLPALDGALDCLAAGIESTLAPANREQICRLRYDADSIDKSRLALLFDPQTAGGLLLALPSAGSADCLLALREAGYATAASIGHTRAGEAGTVSLN